MNPAGAASTFATLVGLVCNFRQERGQQEALNHQNFIEWLEYHRHEDLKNLIVNTAALRTEVDNLLRSDHALMLQKLDRIGQILADLLGRLDEFKGIAGAMLPHRDLSDQAISILRQFVNSDVERLSYQNYGGGSFVLNFGGDDHVEVTDLRFLDDDFKTLVRLRLIYHENGDFYRLTRNAIRYIETLDKKLTENV
jgi:hypothetical protein